MKRGGYMEKRVLLPTFWIVSQKSKVPGAGIMEYVRKEYDFFY
jgi:hypothetical protein